MKIELYDEPKMPGDGRVTVGESDEYYVDICPMLYNHRVVLTPKANTGIYDAGWCYHNAMEAMLAVVLWSQTTDESPTGYIKVAADSRKHTGRVNV